MGVGKVTLDKLREPQMSARGNYNLVSGKHQALSH